MHQAYYRGLNFTVEYNLGLRKVDHDGEVTLLVRFHCSCLGFFTLLLLMPVFCVLNLMKCASGFC